MKASPTRSQPTPLSLSLPATTSAMKKNLLCPSHRFTLALCAASIFLGSQSTHAANDTWSGAISGDWINALNWGTDAPGATTGTTNADVATFNSGSTNTSVTIDSGRNIKSITFDTSAASYTFGGSTLNLTSAGIISLTAAVADGTVETFNAALSLAGNYAINNLSTSGTARFVVAGNITNTATSTLTIGAVGGTGVNTFSGVISDGTGVMSLLIGSGVSSGTGTGFVELTGANTYSGVTKVNLVSGTFTTSGTNSSAGTTHISHGILNLNNASNGGLASGTLTMEAGTLTAGFDGAGILSNAISQTNSSTIAGSRNITFNGDYTNASSGRTLTNSLTAGAVTLNGKLNLGSTISSGSNLTLTGAGNTVVNGVVQDYSGGVGTAAGSLILNASAGGVITLNGANTYTGVTTILGAGRINISNIGNTGSSSNLGANGTISFGSTTTSGTLTYTGLGEASNKVINLAGTTGGASIDQSGSGLLEFTSDLTATGVGAKTLTLQGSTSGTGKIAGAIVDNDSANFTRVAKSGTGTWTLSGNNAYTGSTTLNAGTLKLDYSTNNTSKLSNTATTGTLLLNGGTLELSGGSHTETVLSTTLNTGSTSIKRTSGTSTLDMGAITFTAGAIDFGADSIASTSSTVTNGILSQRATVAGANFAMKSGSNIVAYDYVTSGSTGYTGGATVINTNYSMVGGGSMTANRGATSNTFKIITSGAGQSLDISTGATFTSGAVLFAGTNDYAINTAGTGKISIPILHNYGTGTLTLGALTGSAGAGLVQYGTGKTVLTATASGDTTLAINGGSVQFSNNLQIGTNAAARAITLNNGTLIADTTGGNIALDNAGTFSRTVAIGHGGGTIDVIGGNSLTISGVMSGAGTGPVTFGSGTSNGTINLTAANTYTGATIIRGGTLALGAADRIANTSNVVMAGGTFATGGFNETLGTVTLSANSIIDLGAGSSALVFSDSSATTWGSSITLSFINYTLGQDSIRIGASSGGLTGTQLSQITINGLAASIDANGFLTSAIPEPSTFALLAGGAGLMLAVGRRVRNRRAN